MKNRTVRIIHNGPTVSREEIAKELAYCITKGDPTGYLARITEKYQCEIENEKQNAGRTIIQ